MCALYFSLWKRSRSHEKIGAARAIFPLVISSLCMRRIKSPCSDQCRQHVPSFYAYSLLSGRLGSTTPSIYHGRRQVPSFYSMCSLFSGINDNNPLDLNGRRHVSLFYVFSLLSVWLGSTTPLIYHSRRQVPSFYSMRSFFSLYGWDQQSPQVFMAGVT
jgi:hypothetical protein